jgi:preprotein translocase subunit YajC
LSIALLAVTMLQLGGSPGGSRNLIVLMIYLVFFFLIMWFVVMRPNRKMQERHQSMLSALKKGDDVMTEGGILGQVVHIAEERITLKTAENTRFVVARPKIARILNAPDHQETKKQETKS